VTVIWLQPLPLPSIIADLRKFLLPILNEAKSERMHWKASGGWVDRFQRLD